MKHEMMNLFAVPLYVSSLERQFSEAELKFFERQLRDCYPAVANFSTNNKQLLDDPAMAGIRGIVQKNLDKYLEVVFNTSNDVRLLITQSWLALTRKGQVHHEHTHPNSVASGVLYINLAENDGINFYRNRDNQWYELERVADNYYNASKYFIRTRVGDIVIFPSNVRHGVPEVTAEVDRISLAFNSFFSGKLGDVENSNALDLRTLSGS